MMWTISFSWSTAVHEKNIKFQVNLTDHAVHRVRTEAKADNDCPATKPGEPKFRAASNNSPKAASVRQIGIVQKYLRFLL
jgi:hypothetical protein